MSQEILFGHGYSVLNRDFKLPDDGWYQIEAKGAHPNSAAGVVQIIDEAAAVSIANCFNKEQSKPGAFGMIVDRDHFKPDLSKDTTAYGWATKLDARPDGIYAQIRWTDTGKKAVEGGDYRFFSTEYDSKDLTVLNRGESPARVRPMRLDGLTLTNMNNNKGQKPITNRGVPIHRDPQKEQRKMKTVCTLLGLSEDAAESAVHAEVAKLITNRREHDGEILKITNRATTAEKALKDLEIAQVEIDLETYATRIDPKPQSPRLRGG